MCFFQISSVKLSDPETEFDGLLSDIKENTPIIEFSPTADSPFDDKQSSTDHFNKLVDDFMNDPNNANNDGEQPNRPVIASDKNAAKVRKYVHSFRENCDRIREAHPKHAEK